MEFLNIRNSEEKPKKRAKNYRAKLKQKAHKLRAISNFEDATLFEEEINFNLNY